MSLDGAPLVNRVQDAIMDTVGRFRGEGLTLGEAVCALELVKLDLWSESRAEPEDPASPVA
jgi:hypothetical protein